jgi:hypothetical protein
VYPSLHTPPTLQLREDHGSTPEVTPLWDALYSAGVDVVLSDHEHNYERFAPQDPNGRADPERGIREFVWAQVVRTSTRL